MKASALAIPYVVPPANLEAETALLGAILIDNRAYDEVSDILRPEHFAQGVHGRIYTAISHVIDGGRVANPITLKALFDQDGALTEIGGIKYLAQLAVSAGVTINAADYGRLIVDLWTRRQVIDVCREGIVQAQTSDLEGDARQVIAALDQHLYAIAEGGGRDQRLFSSGDSAAAALELADEAYKNQGKLQGLPTGLSRLDHLLGGLLDEHYYILGGRPSMGKSTLAERIANRAAEHLLEATGGRSDPEPVLVFSMEMTSEALSQRRLANKARIASQKIARGELTKDDWDALFDARRELSRLALFTDDERGLTVSEIRARARRMKRSRGLALIIVDHMQMMRGSPEAMRSGDTAVVSEASRGLQNLAGELRVPVLALSQLSRDLERREDKRPTLSDLRQSGSLEQDADVVLFVFREEYYLSRSEPAQRDGESAEKFGERYTSWETRRDASRNKAEVIVAKHRNGPIGVAHAYFDGARAMFEDFTGAKETGQGGFDL